MSSNYLQTTSENQLLLCRCSYNYRYSYRYRYSYNYRYRYDYGPRCSCSYSHHCNKDAAAVTSSNTRNCYSPNFLYRSNWFTCNWAETQCLSCNVGGGGHRCLASLDSDLEAFTRNPTAGCFTVSATYVTQHLQSLDPNRSPAKDLSLPTQ